MKTESKMIAINKDSKSPYLDSMLVTTTEGWKLEIYMIFTDFSQETSTFCPNIALFQNDQSLIVHYPTKCECLCELSNYIGF